jgi:hypothetical protein
MKNLVVKRPAATIAKAGGAAAGYGGHPVY